MDAGDELSAGGSSTAGQRVSDRLADWLDGLGLLEALADAGLPRMRRGSDGRAHWSDRATGEPLLEQQVADLEATLRGQGDEPEHAVPVALVLLARRARVRRELLESPHHDYASLAALRGASVNATRFAVHKAALDHTLLLVTAGDRTVVPAFQLDAAGELRAELAPVVGSLLSAGMDPWNAWSWLTQPAGLLGGEVPERLVADPDEAAVVAHAAQRLAERVKADPDAPVKPVKPPTSGGPTISRSQPGGSCGHQH